MQAGAWILRTPLVLAVILFAMTFDHTLRMIVTLTSKYYRLIGLPEASFGLLGSLVAVVGSVRAAFGQVDERALDPGSQCCAAWLGHGGDAAVVGAVHPFLGGAADDWRLCSA